MSDNVYMQWVEANSASIRKTLIVVATVLAFAGLWASFTDHWQGATAAWTAAFLCKFLECWLLEKALAELEAAAVKGIDQ